MVKNKINILAASYTAAIVSGVSMFLLGILGNFGVYMGAVDAMMKWHMFFSLSVIGIVGGIIEAAVISFVFVYAYLWVYRKLAK
jgi:hypothetical protein